MQNKRGEVQLGSVIILPRPLLAGRAQKQDAVSGAIRTHVRADELVENRPLEFMQTPALRDLDLDRHRISTSRVEKSNIRARLACDLRFSHDGILPTSPLVELSREQVLDGFLEDVALRRVVCLAQAEITVRQ